MGDLIRKLLPFALRLMHLAPRIRELMAVLEPTFNEFQKVAPQAWSLVRQLHDLMGPTIAEARKAWPKAAPLGVALFDAALPELADQLRREPVVPVASNVRWVQESLNKLGYGPLDLDNKYGKATRRAVTKFQDDHGLRPVDGWAGLVTLAAIYAELKKQT